MEHQPHSQTPTAGTDPDRRSRSYYDPATGSWTQQDSVVGLGDPTTGNRYAYAGDDPVNNADPHGTEVTPGGGYDPSAGFYGNSGSVSGEGRLRPPPRALVVSSQSVSA